MAETEQGHFQYTCPHCGNLFSATPGTTLTVVSCPTCNNRTSILPREEGAGGSIGEQSPTDPIDQQQKSSSRETDPTDDRTPDAGDGEKSDTPSPEGDVEREPAGFPTEWDDEKLDLAIQRAVRSMQEPLERFLLDLRKDIQSQQEKQLTEALSEVDTSFESITEKVKEELEKKYKVKKEDQLSDSPSIEKTSPTKPIITFPPQAKRPVKPQRRKTKETNPLKTLLESANKRIAEAEEIKLDMDEKKKRVEEARVLISNDDMKSAEIILRGVVDNVTELLSNLEKTIEKLRSVKDMIQQARKEGADTKKAETHFARAEPALRERDFNKAQKWAEKAEEDVRRALLSLDEKKTIPKVTPPLPKERADETSSDDVEVEEVDLDDEDLQQLFDLV